VSPYRGNVGNLPPPIAISASSMDKSCTFLAIWASNSPLVTAHLDASEALGWWISPPNRYDFKTLPGTTLWDSTDRRLLLAAVLFAGVFALNLPCLAVASMLGEKRLIKYERGDMQQEFSIGYPKGVLWSKVSA
jgi:hypothetical protein